MPETRFKSDAFEAIHSAASGLHELKAIDKQMMREFDEACIEDMVCAPPHQAVRVS